MTQQTALKIMSKGLNVFLTGPPGSGKSYVISSLLNSKYARKKHIAVTATTGIAASLIHGITINSWAGVGVMSLPKDQLLRTISTNKFLMNRYLETDILIIDEISMMDIEMFSVIDYLARNIRGDYRPFGGIQVILCGDFFQLPPIKSNKITGYLFQSETWQDLNLQYCYLSEQHRQEQDDLLEVLLALRQRRFNKLYLDILTNRQIKFDANILKLVTHNATADQINLDHLNQIDQPMYVTDVTYKGKKEVAKKRLAGLLVQESIALKVGAKVMFIANNPKNGYFNGSQGEVVDFKKNLPIVKLVDNSMEIVVDRYDWEFRNDNNEVEAVISQLPLKLAWAITIHKCQGMSLDQAAVDLSRSFTYGMGYVAISRLKSYQGLYLVGFNSKSIEMDPQVYQFDAEAWRLSEALS